MWSVSHLSGFIFSKNFEKINPDKWLTLHWVF